ncbi:P1 family peptidase [Dulcicalothrix desertica]|nr:P1 family peptidase [Dulcicalothrix desertica]TWH43439.1 L-aminopeptidase/D-esterase-like protein [Dulcicalothrix desertica PCC 7102]
MSNFISRRKLLMGSLGFGFGITPILHTFAQSKSNSAITDVSGIKVGHFTDSRRPTGCTVILTESGAVAGVDVRGAAPGTRETDLLDPKNLVQQVHAILLSGGSAFGLDAATGVMKFLESRGIGYDVGIRGVKVPIVPAAILFDLNVGDAKVRPDAKAGYQACKNASDKLVREGNVGAGAGATVGKFFGMSRAMKSGIGTASIKLPGGITVGAIVAVNAVGDVFDPSNNKLLAGARSRDGKKLLGTMEAIKRGENLPPLLGGTNTTIGVVAMDAKLDKAQCQKIAQMAHDGLARTINPVHTMYDGDTIFALSTGLEAAPVNVTLLGATSALVMAQAVIRAIKTAESIPGLPSSKDLS